MARISRGFRGRRRPEPDAEPGRLPPGQYLTPDFPVLSAGPTPHPPLQTPRRLAGLAVLQRCSEAADSRVTWLTKIGATPTNVSHVPDCVFAGPVLRRGHTD